MARNDIVVWKSPHGGHDFVDRGFLDASESFREGEPVRRTADGTISESPDDPTATDCVGIAVSSGDTTNTNRSFFNPQTGAAYTTNDNVFFTVPSSHTYFASQNFATDGAGTQAAPLLTHIGDEAGLTLASGVWSVDIGATNQICRIVDVLNSQKESVGDTGETLLSTDDYWVVFQIVAHQSLPVTGLAEAPPAA